MKKVNARRKIRWDNIFWLCYDLVKWGLLIAILGWMVGSYVEVLMYRGVEGHDFSTNFLHFMNNFVNNLKG